MNNVSCKRVYEKAWRSHLHTGLMLKAGLKPPNQRRRAPQICFKENCIFCRYIPKQLHALSLICCAYSIKCSAFYNVCLCWSLSERGLGGMQCGKGCCAVKPCVEPVPHSANVTHLPRSVALVWQWQMHTWTQKHSLVRAACGLPPARGLCTARGITGLLLSASSRGCCSWGREEDAQCWLPNMSRLPGTSSVHKCRQF